jgi:hypothetical protein
MGAMTGAAMVTELQRRISQLSTADALAALNRSIRWIGRQGSYKFQLHMDQTLVVLDGATVAAPADLDNGKAMVLQNSNGSPIARIALTDIEQLSNFNIPTQPIFGGINVWDGYIIQSINNVGPPDAAVIFLYPHNGVPVSTGIRISYHRITVDIANSGSSWAQLPKDFDDLIIDMAEAEESRIYDVGSEWQMMMGRVKEQIMVLLDNYKSMSMEPGLVSESSEAIKEKTALGRA